MSKKVNTLITNRPIDNNWKLRLRYDPGLSIDGVTKTGAVIWELMNTQADLTIPISDTTALALILHKKGGS